MGYEGDYISDTDVDNWPLGSGDPEYKAVIDKVEQLIDKVCKTHFGSQSFDTKLNGNGKNRLFIPLHTDILTVTSVFIGCVELDSNWWAHDVNSVFLDPCIGDSMWGKNSVQDGDFYYWKVAAPTTDLYYWIETLAGTSTINRDTAQVQVGNYSVRMDIDALESQAQMRQRVSLLRNRDYRLVFKYLNSEVAKTAKFMLYNEDLGVSLKEDGTWAIGQVWISLANVVAWTNYSLDFKSHPDFANYDLYFENDTALSSSIYFDNVGILTAGVAALLADITEAIFPRGYNNVQVIGTMGESGAVPEAIKQAAVILAKWENDPTLYTYTGLKKSEKMGDYSYTTLITDEAEVLTGVMQADTLLRLYIKRKAIVMAP